LRMASRMHVFAQTRTDGVAAERRVERTMTWRSPRGTAVVLAAVTFALWCVDVARQLQLDVADSGLVLYATAGVLAVGVAVAVARQPGRERMALLMVVWLFVAALDDLAVDWPTSRTATT